ncbi:hypothetical protein [Sorangium sp. So ce1024]|uniref:hypothetical protein n=1 Tax=Sorangium sp. So ce1024 TaxID=3133327 RepID=UPI003F101E2E
MPVMLVTYDVHKSGEQRANVLAFIKEHDHVQVSESCYLIDTEREVTDIYDGLLFAGGGRHEYAVIGPIDNQSAVMLHSNSSESYQWLNAKLPRST